MNTDKYLIEMAADFADILDGLTKGEEQPVKFTLILACPIEGGDRISTIVVSNFENTDAPVMIMKRIVKSHKNGEYRSCEREINKG
jgi:hypothetical protein